MPTKKVTKSKKLVKKTLKGKTAPKKTMKKKVTKPVQTKSVKKAKTTKVKKSVAKTTKSTKTAKKVLKSMKKVPVTVTATKKTRSFKVKLPNSEVYEGRFTGLTPYQAANKALSKYYRENKSSKEIVFSIRESTRGSKRLVYHYNGHRTKLDVPVEYVIKSGNDSKVITKNFKNRLTKIKKAELKKLNLV